MGGEFNSAKKESLRGIRDRTEEIRGGAKGGDSATKKNGNEKTGREREKREREGGWEFRKKRGGSPWQQQLPSTLVVKFPSLYGALSLVVPLEKVEREKVIVDTFFPSDTGQLLCAGGGVVSGEVFAATAASSSDDRCSYMSGCSGYGIRHFFYRCLICECVTKRKHPRGNSKGTTDVLIKQWGNKASNPSLT